jgi:transcriptional regulator with XRE-family HTH domain
MTSNPGFAHILRSKRLALAEQSPREFSLRKVAGRVGIEPSYLSKIERAEQPPPGEEVIKRLALELNTDADELLGVAGKVSSDLQDVIRKRPALIAELLRTVKSLPPNHVKKTIEQIRDGEW